MLGMFSQTASGLGLMVGVIVGAGMFALPYAVAQAGWFWGLFHLVVAFSVLTFIHVLYGSVVRATPGKHRLPGYARTYMGAWAGRVSLLSALGGFYGALLVYGILGGVFLSRLLPGALGAEKFTLLFFVLGACILLFTLRRVGEINFFLTTLLIVFVGVLAVFAAPKIQPLTVPAANAAAWFLPYGVFLFAFAGASAVPDAAELFTKSRRDGVAFRRMLVLSTVIPLVIYAIFVASVLGVSGTNATPEAIFGLEQAIGARAVAVGSLVGFLAVLTSFLALGLDLKNIFRYDIGLPPVVSWGAVTLVPALLFLSGVHDFVRVIGFVGAVTIGIDGILILLLSLRVCRVNGRCSIGRYSFHPALPVLLIAALVAGVAFEIVTIFGILAV